MTDIEKKPHSPENLPEPEANLNAIEPDHYDDVVPDLNSQSITGKIIKWFVIALIVVVAGFMLYWVNQPKQKKEVQNNKTIAQTPTEDTPKPVEPPPDDVEPIGVVKKGNTLGSSGQLGTEQQPKPADWWDRKKMGSASENAPSRSDSSTPERTTEERQLRCDPITGENCQKKNKLSDSLEPATFKSAQAAFMPDLNYLISSVRNISAVLDTAIDSSEPGLLSATLTEDVYSDNHAVKLLERGARVDGQYAGQVKNGYARLGVIWTRIKTPNGVYINIDSLGSDALGRSGMNGYVDNKFWDRFGAAFMLSMFKDSSNYAQYRLSGANNQSYTQNTGAGISNSFEKRMEADSLIPPVLYKNQGDHIQITIARDLDFSPVYSLKLKK